MSVRLSCPYCNAAVAVQAVPPSRRAVCPRCGENFPVKAPSADDPDPHLPGVSSNGEPEPVPPVDELPARALRAPALIGLFLGLAVLGSGLYLVLGHRRTDQSEPAGGGSAMASATLPPAAVPGLGYLPSDTNVAFAVQPGPIVVYAERTGTDPRQFLVRAGVPDRLFAVLDQVGVPLGGIDHLCGGLVVPPENPLPRVVVVLALKAEPADRGAFLKALHAEKPMIVGGLTRHSVDLGGLPATMTSVTPGTYLFATDGKDLDGASAAKGRGSGHFPSGLRQSMDRLSPASVAWAATDATAWGDRPAVKLAAGLLKQPDLAERLARVRAVALGVSLEPDPKLTAAVRAADADAGRRLQDSMAVSLAGWEPPIEIGGSGEWVTVESPFDPKQGPVGLTALLPSRAGPR